MITVANLTYTAARVDYTLITKKIPIEGLSDPERILHIDSQVRAKRKLRKSSGSIS